MGLETKPRLLYCSFCRKDEHAVEKLIGGPGVYICDRCIGLCDKILAGKPTPAVPAWEALGDKALLETLRPAAAAVKAAEEMLRQHVRLLRSRAVSWAAIGDVLGISRQAAWERFSEDP